MVGRWFGRLVGWFIVGRLVGRLRTRFALRNRMVGWQVGRLVSW